MRVGVNCYGLKRAFYQDYDGTLERLKAIGFTSLEPCVMFEDSSTSQDAFLATQKELPAGVWMYDTAGEKIRKIRELGYEVTSVHVIQFPRIGADILEILPRMKEFAKENQIKYYILSLMRGANDIKAFIPALKQAAEELNAEGITFAYHNHEIECMEENGTTALELVMNGCPDIKLQLDVGWVKFAGCDAVEAMKRYRNRIVLLHLKDVREDASAETREECFTAIGEGSIPLAEILAEARNCTLDADGIIIDQDDSVGNILDDLAVGYQNIAGKLR